MNRIWLTRDLDSDFDSEVGLWSSEPKLGKSGVFIRVGFGFNDFSDGQIKLRDCQSLFGIVPKPGQCIERVNCDPSEIREK